jgi:hypothetical protein
VFSPFFGDSLFRHKTSLLFFHGKEMNWIGQEIFLAKAVKDIPATQDDGNVIELGRRTTIGFF